MADDVAGLIEHLGGTADVLGYSLGGAVALRLAIQHPERVRNLILVSITFKRSGSHPEVLDAMDQMTPAIAEMLKQSPVVRALRADRAAARGLRHDGRQDERRC